MAEALVGKLLPPGYETVGTVKGSDLVGLGYKSLYNPVAYKVPGIGKFAEWSGAEGGELSARDRRRRSMW